MGLAASQARLLTITSRKSDCEYQSMALSHQKIALSRDMNIVSSEYQNALDKKKIVYDFYGTHDKSTQLSYGLLMKPSELNEFMPIPVTDNAGRIVLTPDLAAAAERAGIPREGLGCTPSSDVRNAFIWELVNNGTITQTTGASIVATQYNPYAGFGSSEMLTYSVESISFDQFIDDYLSDVTYDFSALVINSALNSESDALAAGYTGGSAMCLSNNGSPITNHNVLSLKELLEGNYGIYGITADLNWNGTVQDQDYERTCAIDKIGTCNFWNLLHDSLAAAIDPNDGMAQSALEYAYNQILEKVIALGPEDFSNAAGIRHVYDTDSSSSAVISQAQTNSGSTYIGYYYQKQETSGSNTAPEGYNDGYSLNLSNMVKAFYTYFAMYMQGLNDTDYSVENTKTASRLMTDRPENFGINVITDVDTTGNNLLYANFYDALFNQIAINGWVENSHMNDNEYLATMLRNGTMFLSSISDDDFYYQSNYATNKYIKEVTDEEGIAKAEAKYQREKRRIQNKESIIDMKMKNLDTEISALNQEYSSIKNIINNSIKNAISRYDA